jgi:murein DD-endopeptidase MepM/ murein hydrolase activator NlpD
MTRPFATGLLLCVVITAAIGQHHGRRLHRHPAPHGNPTQLKSTLRSIREKKAALRTELRKTKHQANVVVEDIHVVDARMERIADEMARTSEHLDASRHEQKTLGQELIATTFRLKQVRAQVRKRLREIYLSGQGSFLSALAGTRTVDDLVAEHTLLEAIARRDREMFDEYTRLQNDVAAKKRRQDDLVVEVRGLLDAKHRQKVVLADTRQEKADVLGALRQKQTQIQRQIAQYDADEASIASEIEAFARRARRPGEVALPSLVGRLSRPAQGRITSGFGMRFHPILHIRRLHAGIDFGAPYGSPIVAAADGEVIAARYSTSFGNMVIIAHGGDISTVYAHCSRVFVHTGEMVKRGQRIAAVGATGLAQGPHLHFEVHIGGKAVNPIGKL